MSSSVWFSPPRSFAAILISRRGFENHLTRFAIADLNCIDNARALFGGDRETIDQAVDWFGKINVE